MMVFFAFFCFAVMAFLLAMVISLLVGFFQRNRRSGVARASRLLAMGATLVPCFLVGRAIYLGPTEGGDSFQAAFCLWPFVLGFWLVVVCFEEKQPADR